MSLETVPDRVICLLISYAEIIPRRLRVVVWFKGLYLRVVVKSKQNHDGKINGCLSYLYLREPCFPLLKLRAFISKVFLLPMDILGINNINNTAGQSSTKRLQDRPVVRKPINLIQDKLKCKRWFQFFKFWLKVSIAAFRFSGLTSSTLKFCGISALNNFCGSPERIKLLG